MKSPLKYDEAYAKSCDQEDPLARYRESFLIPKAPDGTDSVYLTGNSLGLQPKKVQKYILEELEDWARLGVEGHVHARHPWLPYHENVTEAVARIVGALPTEVIVMNSLTVNLHLMMVSFYRPTKTRFKIMVEKGAFPSDQYAVASQAKFHGYEPSHAILEVSHNMDSILETIEREGDQIALVLLGNVNYLTGQAFDMTAITRAARAKGCAVGFDLAHGAGNLQISLHDSGPDFAVWCSYKYLNAGPGAIAGCFVHERNADFRKHPRFAGWWGQNKSTRFQMGSVFDPIAGAEGWQLSNPPIFQLASLRASMEVFDSATMPAIRKKSELITGYLEALMDQLPKGFFEILTPRDPEQRGAQLSIRCDMKRLGDPKELVKKFVTAGVICDFREPDIIRAAPAPLYTRFHDVYRFVEVLKTYAKH